MITVKRKIKVLNLGENYGLKVTFVGSDKLLLCPWSHHLSCCPPSHDDCPFFIETEKTVELLCAKDVIVYEKEKEIKP